MAKLIRIYSPLNIEVTMTTVDSQLIQEYDVDRRTYTPDRRMVPTVIQPHVQISDPGGLITSGNKNSQLPSQSIKWYENEPIPANEILPTNTQFVIDRTSTNSNRGRITVKKNVNAEDPLTLYFEAVFSDQILVGGVLTERRRVTAQGSAVLSTNVSAQAPLVLHEDYPRGRIFNPLKKYAHMLMSADLQAGQESIPAAYWWYKRDGEVDTLLGENYEGHNLSQIKIPSSEIGKEQLYLVKVQDCRSDLAQLRDDYFQEHYDPELNNEEEVRLAADALTLPEGFRPTPNASKQKSQELTLATKYPICTMRVITSYGDDKDLIEIPEGVESFDIWVEITSPAGVVDDPDAYFNFDWGSGKTGSRITINSADLGLDLYTLEPIVTKKFI